MGILLVTGDRGLAGSFNSQIIRAGVQLQRDLSQQGKQVRFSIVGRRGASTMRFRGEDLHGEYVGFTDRPAFANAREIAEDLIASYVDKDLNRVDLIYNRYVSPLTQYVAQADAAPGPAGRRVRGGSGGADSAMTMLSSTTSWPKPTARRSGTTSPSPRPCSASCIPEYAQLNVYRALLESTASEHGARMTAMRNAADNAKEVISDLTLEMNRVRQAEITQEILEVVAGAEGLS